MQSARLIPPVLGEVVAGVRVWKVCGVLALLQVSMRTPPPPFTRQEEQMIQNVIGRPGPCLILF